MGKRTSHGELAIRLAEVGHAGAAGGHGHFRVTIVAEAFRGMPPVARHRLVYAAVDDLLRTDIHALAIEASPPPP